MDDELPGYGESAVVVMEFSVGGSKKHSPASYKSAPIAAKF